MNEKTRSTHLSRLRNDSIHTFTTPLFVRQGLCPTDLLLLFMMFQNNLYGAEIWEKIRAAWFEFPANYNSFSTQPCSYLFSIFEWKTLAKKDFFDFLWHIMNAWDFEIEWETLVKNRYSCIPQWFFHNFMNKWQILIGVSHSMANFFDCSWKIWMRNLS